LEALEADLLEQPAIVANRHAPLVVVVAHVQLIRATPRAPPNPVRPTYDFDHRIFYPQLGESRLSFSSPFTPSATCNRQTVCAASASGSSPSRCGESHRRRRRRRASTTSRSCLRGRRGSLREWDPNPAP